MCSKTLSTSLSLQLINIWECLWKRWFWLWTTGTRRQDCLSNSALELYGCVGLTLHCSKPLPSHTSLIKLLSADRCAANSSCWRSTNPLWPKCSSAILECPSSSAHHPLAALGAGTALANPATEFRVWCCLVSRAAWPAQLCGASALDDHVRWC